MDSHGSEIAIIGMAGRFPGANNIESFWRNLRDGVESITFFDEEDLELTPIDREIARHPHYVKAAPILEDIDLFDAGFFGITHLEAELMDPQHRLLMECAWEALEHAGYDPETYKRTIGIFSGARTSSYKFNLYLNPDITRAFGTLHIGLGNDLSYLSTRIAYKLNLRGPSYSFQTACSTSLVAVHMACQSLLVDECQMALAGGVTINVPHKRGYLYQEGGMESPDGHCRTFDARAGGTVFGSGLGLVVLKRLADALADGDCIYAVIKGSATNNDGALKASFTAPGVQGQATVIAEALANAGVPAETISYVEAHGTGTPLGDPIEVRALTRAFRASTAACGYCALGSTKTNIGHLDVAAGIGGLIKTVLALKHRQIPPILHFERPNPEIDFASSPFYINTQLSDWPERAFPRRAGVSSFGAGGTNAHVVLEEAPAIAPSGPGRPWLLLPISARSAAALDRATENLAMFLGQSEASLDDVAYTLQVGRKRFNHRRALVCRSRDDAIEALTAPDRQRLIDETQPARDRRVVFMFPGQGAQYVGMGRDLYRTEPDFRKHVDRCCELLAPHLGLDLREVIFDEGRRTKDEGPATNDEHPDKETRRQGDKEAAGLLVSLSPGLEPGSPTPALCAEPMSSHKLDQTIYAQPALFVIEYALARMWMAWGIQPSAMIGHSIGEYVAACLAGVFALEDALALVAARGRMMQELPSGAMLSVALPAAALRARLGAQLALAADNAPSLCVIAGPADAIAQLHDQLAAEGVECRRLRTSHAFHSAMMDPIVEAFAEQVREVPLRAPAIPYISNLSGGWVTAAQATDPRYWAQHLRSTVRFADGMRVLLGADAILLEAGPGNTLGTLARQQPAYSDDRAVLASLRRPHDQQPDTAFAMTTLGRLWLAGARVDWAGVHAHERRLRIALPTYPFERQRYWISPGQQTGSAAPAYAARPTLDGHPLLGARQRSAPPIIQFESALSASQPAYLRDHRILGMVLLPAAAYIEMALSAAADLPGKHGYYLVDVTIEQALILPDDDTRRVSCILTQEDQEIVSFGVYSGPSDPDAPQSAWTIHARGKLRRDRDQPAAASPTPAALGAIRERCPATIMGTELYPLLWNNGFQFGPTFQGVEQIWRRDGEALGEVRLPVALAQEAHSYRVHPALLDACLQVLAAALPIAAQQAGGEGHFLPIGFGTLRVHQPFGAVVWSHVTLQAPDPAADTIAADVQVLDEAGHAVADIAGMRLKRVGRAIQRSAASLESFLYTVEWRRQPAPTPAQQPPPGDWLIFADAAGLGQRLSARLAAQGHTCTIITADQAEHAAGSAAGAGTLDRLRSLVRATIGADRSRWRGVVYLWGLDLLEPADPAGQAAPHDQPLGCISALGILQGLVSDAGAALPRLWLITRGAQLVAPEQANLHVAQSPLWGLGKVIALEHPELRCARLDLDPLAGEAELDMLVHELMADDREDQVALRGSDRYVARLQSYTLQSHTAAQERQAADRPDMPNFPLRADGAYLITGGLGGIGLRMARWMAQQGAGRLVLAGRHAPSSRARREIEAIESCGAQVEIAEADVADSAQVLALIERIQSGPAPLRGLVHAAGILDDGALLQLDEARFTRVLAPKIAGAWNLHQATMNLSLDFFVLFSSAAAIFGSPGQGNYVAANCFLDALARLRRLRGLPALSINWGPWAEVGMAANVWKDQPAAIQASAMIEPDQGVALVGRLLRDEVAQVSALPAAATELLAAAPQFAALPLFRELIADGAAGAPALARRARPSLASAYAAPRNDLEQATAEIWQTVLGIDMIGIYDDFFELGGHSLLASQLIRLLCQTFEVDLPLRSLYTAPTIAALTAVIEDLLIEEIEGLPEEQVARALHEQP